MLVSETNDIQDEPSKEEYDGIVIKVQMVKQRAKVIYRGPKGFAIERMNGSMEDVYLGRLASNTLEFLWYKNLSKDRHKERLSEFSRFFDCAFDSCPYFSLFPEQYSQEEIESVTEASECFSPLELYMKIPFIRYEYDEEIDEEIMKSARRFNSSIVKAKHYLEIKSLQALFSNSIRQKISANLLQLFTLLNRHIPEEKQILNEKVSTPAAQLNSMEEEKSSAAVELAIIIEKPQVCIHNEIKKAQGILTTEKMLGLMHSSHHEAEKTGWVLVPGLELSFDPTDLGGEKEIVWPSKEGFLEIAVVASNCEITVSRSADVEVIVCLECRSKV